MSFLEQEIVFFKNGYSWKVITIIDQSEKYSLLLAIKWDILRTSKVRCFKSYYFALYITRHTQYTIIKVA